MGRPPKAKEDKFISISCRIPPDIAKQLTALRSETGETLAAQVQDGLRRHIRARKRSKPD